MRFIAFALCVLGLFAGNVASAAENNHFSKGTKSYQKSAPAEVESSEGADIQASTETSAEQPQDISPAAGAEETTEPTTKDVMVESMKLPRK